VALAIDRPTFDAHDEADAAASDASDEALARAAVRDREAFAVLYRRHVSDVYRYCHRRLGTRERAEDATATTFERALAGIGTFRRGPFRAWLFTIARNATVDAYRRMPRDVPLSETFDRADDAPGPEETAAAREDASWVRGLLEQLTSDQREVVELRLAGLTDQEIGRVLGKRHGAIRMIQHRTLKRLRQLADEEISNATRR